MVIVFFSLPLTLAIRLLSVTIHHAVGTVHAIQYTLATVLFIHRRFSVPCGHHAGRHQGCCPPCLTRGHCQEGRGAGHHCPSPCPGRRLGADGYSFPSACAIFVFIVVFPDRGLAARPHRLFDLRRHGRRQTSPSGGRSAQRPPTGEHRPRLHQLRQLA
jgi:hypothetical protein